MTADIFAAGNSMPVINENNIRVINDRQLRKVTETEQEVR
jgi:hypothetical protein